MEKISKTKENPKLVVVIPAYCEVGKIGETVLAALPFCPSIIVVDDGSGDGTADAARTAGAEVIVHQVNQGKGGALQTGFARALELGADVIVTLDADGQHDPAEIEDFMAKFRDQNVDVLVGNRMTANRNMPWIRRRTNQFMSWLLSQIMQQRVPDTQNGYRLYRSDVIPFTQTDSHGFAAESEQLLYIADQGFRIGSVPVRTIYQDEVSSIHPIQDTARFFKMIFRYYKHDGAREHNMVVAV
ncbi:MAG: glycosyltransferase family 2 protein [Verrucomicrobiota bacterium]